MMLAVLSVLGMTHIHRMNAVKAVLGALINGVAVVAFVVAGAVAWAPGLVMIVGGILGGYAGASIARRVEPKLVRRLVLVVAWANDGVLFSADVRVTAGRRIGRAGRYVPDLMNRWTTDGRRRAIFPRRDMPDERDVKKNDEATLAVPGILSVGPEASGRARIRVGPAAGWMVLRKESLAGSARSPSSSAGT